jgi:hypothetical protein
VEYNWTDHRVYWHKYTVNDVYNKGYPLGFWGGPHSQSIFAGYGVTLLDTKWMVSYSDAMRGQITQEMKEDYSRYPYSRYSGPKERLRQLRFSVERRLFRDVQIEFAVQKIWWTNPGFDPFDPSDDNHDGSGLPKVNKTSFTIGLFYNFKYPGHGHPYQVKS